MLFTAQKKVFKSAILPNRSPYVLVSVGDNLHLLVIPSKARNHPYSPSSLCPLDQPVLLVFSLSSWSSLLFTILAPTTFPLDYLPQVSSLAFWSLVLFHVPLVGPKKMDLFKTHLPMTFLYLKPFEIIVPQGNSLPLPMVHEVFQTVFSSSLLPTLLSRNSPLCSYPRTGRWSPLRGLAHHVRKAAWFVSVKT